MAHTTYNIRPATEADLPAILSIYTHYVLNTTVALLIHEPRLSYISERYQATKERGLPYLVAVAASPVTSTADTTIETDPAEAEAGRNGEKASENGGEVLGYAHASPFKGIMIGYAPSVEITIFCHPRRTAAGIGSALMTTFLDELGRCKHVAWEAGYEDEDEKEEHAVKNVFAVVSQDVERKDGMRSRGEESLGWYERFGFKIAGRMEKVGWKFGREVDVLYLRKGLE